VRARQAEAQTEPIMTRVVPVNYANATQLKAILERLLGACATIAVDGRTNTLILSGTPSCLGVWQGTRSHRPLRTGLVPYADALSGDSSGSIARTSFSP
jgi:hypothetical protein